MGWGEGPAVVTRRDNFVDSGGWSVAELSSGVTSCHGGGG